MADVLIKSKKEQTKQRILIAIFLVVLIITLFVLWWGFLKPSTSTVYIGNTAVPKSAGDSSSQYGDVKIDFNVLESQFLKELQTFKNIAPLQKNSGRDNPFLPLEVKEEGI